MISGWDIYWVMQMDSINSALIGLMVTSFIVCVILVIVTTVQISDTRDYFKGEKEEENNKVDEYDKIRRKALNLIPLGVFFMLLVSFMPSTKALSMIMVIPRIANNENIQDEAKDLYNLAKEGLKEIVDEVKDEVKDENTVKGKK